MKIINNFEVLDFCECNEAILCQILKIRNDERVAKWMYSRDISMQAHLNFVDNLKTCKNQKYWVVLQKFQNLNSEILGVVSLSRVNLAHKNAYLGIYKNPDSEISNKGAKLLEILETLAQDLGLRMLFLEVMSSNTQALNFYNAHKYQQCGILKDFIKQDDGFCDAIVMSKTLDSQNSFGASFLDSLDSENLDSQKFDKPDSQNLQNSPLIIAELSANHAGSLQTALDSIKAIAKSGANAVKFQTYTPDCLTLDCKNEYFRIHDGLWKDKYFYELYKSAQTPWEWHAQMFELAKELGLIAFSSPFSARGVEFLEKLDCPIYKIASFEVLDLELIKTAASTRKPMILSSGIASDYELQSALETARKFGANDLTLLACSSAYPAPLDSVNLWRMADFGRKFGVKFGLSDHTLGNLACVMAVALGASAIEKHFILDKSINSADSAFSLDFEEFCALVEDIKNAVKILGSESKFSESKKADSKKGREFARGIWVAQDIQKGQILHCENVKVLRPNSEIFGGLNALEYERILGKRAARDLKFGEPLKNADFE